MLKDFVEKKHYVFHESFDNWEDAIRASCAPLLADGSIETAYINQIIKCVHEFGPYIVIMPDVALPHAAQGAVGVHNTTISFMKVEESVHFDLNDPEKDARLFFVLAAVDPDAHLVNISKLCEMLGVDGLIPDLLAAKGPEDLSAIAEKYNI